jgi:hypothetical protein
MRLAVKAAVPTVEVGRHNRARGKAQAAITSPKRSGGGANERVSDLKSFALVIQLKSTLMRILTGRWQELTLEANMGGFGTRAGR